MKKIVLGSLLFLTLLGCSTANVVSPVANCSFSECVSSITGKVQANAKWICDEKSNDKTVKVASVFNRDGSLVSAGIATSSGDIEFDNAAIAAVKSSSPLVELANMSDGDFEKASEIVFTFVGNK